MSMIIIKFFYFLWIIIGVGVIVIGIQSVIESIKNGQIKFFLDRRTEWKNKRKLTKDTSEKQIKKYNKKKGVISYDALKFEYSEICKIVSDIADKFNLSNYSEVYILKYNEYVKKKNSYSDKFNGTYSLDNLACLIKSLLEEPIIKVANGDVTNLTVIENVIKTFSDKNISYCNNLILGCYNKEQMLLEMQDNFRLYDDDIFLISMYIIEKIL